MHVQKAVVACPSPVQAWPSPKEHTHHGSGGFLLGLHQPFRFLCSDTHTTTSATAGTDAKFLENFSNLNDEKERMKRN